MFITKLKKFQLPLIGLSISILLVLILTTLMLYDNTKKIEPIETESDVTFNGVKVTESQFAECKEILKNSIIGDWAHPPNSEIPPQPTFTFTTDGLFVLKDSEKNEIINGNWEFDKETGQIKLIIRNDYYEWSEILNSDLNQYKSVKDYSYDKKYLVLQFNYFMNKNSEFSRCEESKFFLDIFNVFYYKSIE